MDHTAFIIRKKIKDSDVALAYYICVTLLIAWSLLRTNL